MNTEDKNAQEETRTPSEEMSFEEMMRKMMSACDCAEMMEQMMACCALPQEETSEGETTQKA